MSNQWSDSETHVQEDVMETPTTVENSCNSDTCMPLRSTTTKPQRGCRETVWKSGQPSNDRKGSSTISEMHALIVALVSPVPLHFPIDSLSTLTKGLMKCTGCFDVPKRLMKSWGLEKDGDVWASIRRALISRPLATFRISKVNGHAVEDDRGKGISKPRDKAGNGKADELYRRGIDEHGGPMFINVVNLVIHKPERYNACMVKARNITIAVFREEKEEERVRSAIVQEGVQGFDGAKFAKATGKLRGCEEQKGSVIRLECLHRSEGCISIANNIQCMAALTRSWLEAVGNR